MNCPACNGIGHTTETVGGHDVLCTMCNGARKIARGPDRFPVLSFVLATAIVAALLALGMAYGILGGPT